MSPSRWELYRPSRPAALSGWRLEVVAPPARLFGANGLRIGPDGRLWLAELVGDHLTAWDAEADVLSVVSPMGSTLSGPDDLAFGDDGTVYVTETLNGRVTCRRPDGEYGVLLEDTPAPNGITVDPGSGRLFVDEMREGGRVLELDPARPGQARVVADGLAWCNALERGPDGRLYLPQVLTGEVVSVDPDRPGVRRELQGLATPTAVKFDARGRLVVSAASEGVLLRVDLATGATERLAAPGAGIDNFCFDARGNLYVSNFIESSVVRYAAASGECDRVLSGGGLMGPYHLARWDDSTLLVADANSIALVGLDGRLRRLTRLLLDQPFVAVGAERVGDHVIALTLAGEVFRFNAEGGGLVKLLAATAGETSQYLSTQSRGATALGRDGEEVLVGLVGGAVVWLDAEGKARRTVETGLSRITAVAGRDGRVAACDAEAGRLVLLGGGLEARTVDGLSAPEGVAVTADGWYVAERGHGCVTWLGAEGDRREVVATELPLGMPQSGRRLGRRASLLAEASGSVLVGCDGDGSVRRLRARTPRQ
jgi:sugar lactone lactonase YvrE